MMMEVRYSLIDVNAHEYLTDLHAVCRYWQELRGDGSNLAPSWDQVDLLQLPPDIVPRVCVLDVDPVGPDFHYRFWGTAITTMHHYDLSGQSVRNLTPDHYATCIWLQYCAVLEKRSPLGFLTEVPLEPVGYTHYAAVRLPLSSDGASIDKILSAEAYGDEEGQLRRLFEDIWVQRETTLDP